jgi:hypothetical protein
MYLHSSIAHPQHLINGFYTSVSRHQLFVEYSSSFSPDNLGETSELEYFN